LDPLHDFEARNSGVRLPDVLADVREAFGRLEAAIAHVEPARCRGYVSDSFYQLVDSEVMRLANRGRSRVHAGFEVIDVVVEEADAPGRLKVLLRAASTLEEFDHGSPPPGPRPMFIWVQDVDVIKEERGERAGRWIIGGLGSMTIEREVSGPVRTLDRATLDEMEAHEAERDVHQREDEEWSHGQTHAVISFLRLRVGA
jgi:hypothetical protein